MNRFLAVLEEARRWIWVLALLAGLAGVYRIFVGVPRQQQAVAAVAGAAGERIHAVEAAAARGDEAEVQRRHAEAIERAEELLGTKR